MAGNGYDPIVIPEWAWHRESTRSLLADRDIGALFKFAAKYGGASQTRIATACGLSQGRVNEIVNGRREVGRLDVLERIAIGLGMPDDARNVLGLAPRYPAQEIVTVFPTQAEAVEEIQRLATVAERVDILAVRGLGIIGLNNSMLRAALLKRASNPLRLRVALLHPDSDSVAVRAAEIGESAEALAGGIRMAEATLREFAERGANLEVYRYSQLPVWRLLIIDDTLYVGSFDVGWEGHESTMTKVPPNARGALYNGFRRMFDGYCRSGERVV